MKSVFVDSNVIIYLIDQQERSKRMIAQTCMSLLSGEGRLMLSMQSIREVYSVVRRKQILSLREARAFCRPLFPFAVAPENQTTVENAWRIQDETSFGWWHALLLASAQAAGCGFFLSEDLSHKRLVGDVLIHNPFLEPLQES